MSATEDVDLLAALNDSLARYMSSRCHAESTRERPERAQRLTGQRFYLCELEKGHDGPHRWPRNGSIAEWVAS